MTLLKAGAIGMSLSLLSVTAIAAERKFDKTLTVEPGGTLTVNADGGNVTVTGADADHVTVHIVAKGSSRRVGRLELSAEKTTEGVTVLAKDPDSSWLDLFSMGGDDHIEVTVQVPRHYDSEVRTSGGNLSISGIRGDTQATTSGGDVRVNRIEGDIRAHTSGGNVDVTDIQGDVKAGTSGGNVVARNARGDVELATSGGNVVGEGIDGAIQAKTSGGNIRLELVGANRGVSASTAGGDVALTVPKGISAAIDASTSGGSVSSDLPVTSSRVSEGKLNGTINGGGETIRLRTSGGDIDLRAGD